MTTGLVILFAIHGCGQAPLEISACWMQEDGVENRFLLMRRQFVQRLDTTVNGS